MEVDDIYSILVYDNFINRIDYDRKYFLKSDIAIFDQWREKLDDLLFDYSSDFFDIFINMWETRLIYIKDSLNKIDFDKIDFNLKEDLEINPDKRDYFESRQLLMILAPL